MQQSGLGYPRGLGCWKSMGSVWRVSQIVNSAERYRASSAFSTFHLDILKSRVLPSVSTSIDGGGGRKGEGFLPLRCLLSSILMLNYSRLTFGGCVFDVIIRSTLVLQSEDLGSDPTYDVYHLCSFGSHSFPGFLFSHL